MYLQYELVEEVNVDILLKFKIIVLSFVLYNTMTLIH